MKTLLRDVDHLLRGAFTREDDLNAGRIPVPVRTLVRAGLLLGVLYGVFMGLYAVLRPGNASVLQLLATMLKVPLLFLLTLTVTFPSLYVFSALRRSRLGSSDTLRLLLAALTINLAVLASFGPVTGFFTLSTDSYPFMVLLNVAFFTLAGLGGMAFLRRAMNVLFSSDEVPAGEHRSPDAVGGPAAAPTGGDGSSSAGGRPGGEGAGASADASAGDPAPRPEEATTPPPGDAPAGRPPDPFVRGAVRRPAAARSPDDSQAVLRVWVVIFAVVGAQMGWILRPFVGAPDLPFELYRERESNVFLAVLEALRQLFA